MTNNSDGLSPTLRPQLGKAFGRALPAPFQFANGIKFDGVNDLLVGTPVARGLTLGTNDELAVECWVNPSVGSSNAHFLYLQNESSEYVSGFKGGIRAAIGGATVNLSNIFTLTGTRNHFASSYSKVNGGYCWINGIQNGTFASGYSVKLNNISYFCVGAADDTYGRIPVGNFVYRCNRLIDELRIYDRAMSFDEARINYNSGIGENPSKTEGLWGWWNFEEAEDPALLFPGGLPGGWPAGAYGIRDKSGNGRHLYQLNMGNDSTLSGAIQTF